MPTILVADDDDVVRSAAMQWLRGAGYSVLQAVDGEDAVEIIHRNCSIDVFILDVIMPRLGGMRVAERVPENGKPVLYLCGVAEAALIRGTAAHQLVMKPLERSRLLDAVYQALTRQRAAA